MGESRICRQPSTAVFCYNLFAMKIKIRVVTNAKRDRITKKGKEYKIYVSTPPENGRANARVAELLAEHFKIKKSQVKITKGFKSKEKIIVINL